MLALTDVQHLSHQFDDETYDSDEGSANEESCYIDNFGLGFLSDVCIESDDESSDIEDSILTFDPTKDKVSTQMQHVKYQVDNNFFMSGNTGLDFDLNKPSDKEHQSCDIDESIFSFNSSTTEVPGDRQQCQP